MPSSTLITGKKQYKIRSGIDATISALKRSHGIGKLRVRRLVKVSFAVTCKAIACNIKRWAKAYVPLNTAIQYVFGRIWGHILSTSHHMRNSSLLLR